MEEPIPSGPPPSEPTNSAPASAPEVPVRKPGLAFDRSDLIALIALVISILGTLLAYRETSLLSEQQSLAMEQKAASVWPYIDIERNFSRHRDSIVEVRLILENSGIGPALISSLNLRVDGRIVRADSVAGGLAEKFTDQTITQTSSHTISNSILAAGERAVLFELEFNEQQIPFELISEIAEAVAFECCYCSVYGDCWEYVEDSWAARAPDCIVPGAVLRSPAR